MTRFGLGIDVGGTFTDIVAYDPATGRQASHKQLTTHADPSRGVMAGIDRLLADNDIAPSAIGRVVHATTLFSNAVIERKGAPTGLITTRGFRDTLEIGRERKYELYDINIVKPAPLIPRHLRLEVSERMAVDGGVRLPLDEAALLEAAANSQTRASARSPSPSCTPMPIPATSGRRSSYRGAPPDARAFRLRRRGPRDPRIRARLHHRHQRLHQAARRALSVLARRPGRRPRHRRAAAADAVQRRPHQHRGGQAHAGAAPGIGPAAGALVAARLGAGDGGAHVLAFDMGGTTAKLSIIDDGKPTVAYSFEVARERRFIEGSGLPVRISTLELIEIGAGGGSIARLDDIGLLKVGPASAGSEPGPAAYGRGGKLPTVTDADLVLGLLDPAYFLGGTMPIDLEAAKAALAPLAERAGLAVTDLAWGIHDLVNENMANAARVHIAEHGKDPRRYTLLATGGAGPVHAYYVAKKLGLKRLIAPRAAGVASALGLLIAPARVDRVATVARELDRIQWPDLEATFRDMETKAKAVLAATLPEGAAPAIARLADIRYVGQASELVVPLPAGPYSAASRGSLMHAFEQAYRRRIHAHAADHPDRDHQRAPERQPRRRGRRAAASHPHVRCRKPAKGHAPRLLPRVPRLPPHRRLRPLRAHPRRRLRRPGHRRGARIDPRHRPRRPLPGRRKRQPHRHHRLRDNGMAETSRAAANRPFDAVTLEILWRRTISAVDEAGKALRRTSFSTLVNESTTFRGSLRCPCA